jgi:Family of unknown function (DUF5706)
MPSKMLPYDKLFVCSDLLNKQTKLISLIETRANIVIGLSSAAVAFAISGFSPVGHPLVLPVLIITALTSIVFALMAIKPPSIFTWRRQAQSLFYHTHIAKIPRDKYIKELARTLGDTNATVKQYAIEIHNLCEHSIKYKKRFAHIAINIFTIGIFATVLAWII